jgi:Nucleotidyl transferase AbiEii toxin, Type IV TA system
MSFRQQIALLFKTLWSSPVSHRPTAEIIDVDRHAAEKFHGMTRDFGDRENSRVRDLVDLVILTEHDLLHIHELRVHINSVWRERNNESPPSTLPAFPETWPARYERLASEHDLSATSFEEAVRIVRHLWFDANAVQGGDP